MIRSLRPYQSDELNAARREAGKGFKSILIQLVTGGGKTRMVAAAINNAISRAKPGQDHISESRRQRQTVWFIVPRKELLWQSSRELLKWGIKHGTISAKSNESAAFQVHICSKDTLIRRIKEKRVRKWPDVIFIDEAHLALDQQLFIKNNATEGTLFLGWTATPERLDGKGLKSGEPGGMYETIVFGPDLVWMVEHDFLKRPKIYTLPPVIGLNDLKFNTTGDVNAKKLTQLYIDRAAGGILYGGQIEHYRKFGLGRSFLIFCRSIIDAGKVADEFTDSGFRVESIDGTMSDSTRQDKIKRVESGQLDGLTTVDLVTYGLDVPKISCIIMLRPTASVALFFQMIGRGLRPDNEHEDCLIFDHVGNCDEKKHGHPLIPREWNFEGRKKKEKIPKDAIEKIDAAQHCDICWDLIIDGVCRSCGVEKGKKSLKPLKQVDGWLVEITEPTPLKERPPENRRYYQDMIAENIDRFKAAWEPNTTNGKHAGGVIDSDAVGNLLTAAYDLRRRPMWVYYTLAEIDPDEDPGKVYIVNV